MSTAQASWTARSTVSTPWSIAACARKSRAQARGRRESRRGEDEGQPSR